jgi:hypothetical protein
VGAIVALLPFSFICCVTTAVVSLLIIYFKYSGGLDFTGILHSEL